MKVGEQLTHEEIQMITDKLESDLHKENQRRNKLAEMLAKENPYIRVHGHKVPSREWYFRKIGYSPASSGVGLYNNIMQGMYSTKTKKVIELFKRMELL